MLVNNEIFRRLLYLTQLNRDHESLAYIFRLGSIKTGSNKHVSKSKVREWRTVLNEEKLENLQEFEMPDSAIEDFFAGLFEVRDLADKKGLTLFDCSGIIDDIKELSDE